MTADELVQDPNGCPACGRDIDALGGNPDCEVCAAEPAVDPLDEYAYCDECHHSGRRHVNAHDLDEPAKAFAFANATCWAENICDACSPALAVQLAELRKIAITESEARVLDGNR
jgi:hypothetical protein